MQAGIRFLVAPIPPDALPLFRHREWEAGEEVRPAGGRRRQWWDDRCNAILLDNRRLSNGEIAERIAAETGLRFSTSAVSLRRSALGLDRFKGNDWTSPLRRWQPWQGRNRVTRQ